MTSPPQCQQVPTCSAHEWSLRSPSTTDEQDAHTMSAIGRCETLGPVRLGPELHDVELDVEHADAEHHHEVVVIVSVDVRTDEPLAGRERAHDDLERPQADLRSEEHDAPPRVPEHPALRERA